MSDDDLAQLGIRLAARPANDGGSPEEASRVPAQSAIGRFLQRTHRVLGFVGLGVGAALMFGDLDPVGLAIIFVAVAVLLAEFEDVLCAPPNQRL